MQIDYIELLKGQWNSKVNDEHEQIGTQFQLYIPAMLGVSEIVSNDKRKDALAEVQQFLHSDIPLMLLLGDSGAGKTLFGQWLTNHMWQEQTQWIPIFIHLPAHPIKKGFFEKYLNKHCQLSEIKIDDFRNKHKILLILDSFDEMKAKYQRKNLYQLGKLNKWQMKVIISCRSEALVSFDDNLQDALFEPDENREIEQKPTWIKRYVQQFDMSQISPYIEKWKICNPTIVNKSINYHQTINDLPDLINLISNPFILWTILFSLPKILEKYNKESLLQKLYLTRLELYDCFTKSWFERQRKKLYDNGLIDKIWANTIVKDFQNYCQQLANFLWQQNENNLKYEYIRNETKSKLVGIASNISAKPEESDANILDLFFSPTGKFNGDNKKPLKLIRQGALLRISDGNIYSFLHHSLLEYFAAKKLFTSASTKARIALGSELNSQLLTTDLAIIRLGADIIKKGRRIKDQNFELSLWEVIEESKHEKRLQTAAANAATILVAANVSFADKDLKRARISGANLSGGNFEGTDFREADLRDVQISNAWMANVKLNGACLDRINCSERIDEHFDQQLIDCKFTLDGMHYIAITTSRIMVYLSSNHKMVWNHKVKLKNSEELVSLAVSSQPNLALIGTAVQTNDYHAIPYGRMIIINYKTGKIIQQLVTKEEITKVTITPNGKLALYLVCDYQKRNTIELKSWDLETNINTIAFTSYSSISTFSMSPNGSFVLLGSSTGAITQWSCETKQQLGMWRLDKDRYEINDIAITADNRSALIATHDKNIKLITIENGKCRAVWQGHKERVFSVAISPDSTWALSTSNDYTLKRWDFNAGKCVRTWPSYQRCYRSVAISPDGTWAFATNRSEIKSWDMHSIEHNNSQNDQDYEKYQKASLWLLAINYNLNQLLLGSMNDNTLKVVNLTNGEKIATYKVVNKYYHNLHEKIPQTLFANYSEATIKNWNITSTKRTSKVILDTCWALSPSENGTITSRDFETGDCTGIWEGHTVETNSISPDGKWKLRIGAEHFTIEKVDCQSNQVLAIWRGHRSYRAIFTISPDGLWVISASEANTVMIWNASNGKLLKEYTFPNRVDKLYWSQKNPRLVIMGIDEDKIIAWLFNTESATLSLLWRTTTWDLNLENAELLGVYGLKEREQRLFTQKGAKVQVSAKSSEDQFTNEGKKKGILTLREEWHPYDSKNPPHSIFDKAILIRPLGWAASIVRRKRGEGRIHAFILLESIEENYYHIRRIDFFLEQRHQLSYQDQSSGQTNTLFGLGLIEITDISLFDAQSLVQQCCARTVGITAQKGMQLIKNIREDQNDKIGYCLMGSGSLYRMFRMKEATEHHNCMSWCEKHLSAIGVTDLAQRHWLEEVVQYTPWQVPEHSQSSANNNAEEAGGAKCVIN